MEKLSFSYKINGVNSIDISSISAL